MPILFRFARILFTGLGGLGAAVGAYLLTQAHWLLGFAVLAGSLVLMAAALLFVLLAAEIVLIRHALQGQPDPRPAPQPTPAAPPRPRPIYSGAT